MYNIFSRQRDRNNMLLSKEYWMKDNSSKDCFACGKPFTTFRRRHHCRLCGQIFCSECTTLMPGQRFQQNGKIRMCNSCLSYDYEDSSEDEDEAIGDEEDDVASKLGDDDAKSTIITSSTEMSDNESDSSSEDESSMTLYTPRSESMSTLYHVDRFDSNLRVSRSSYNITQRFADKGLSRNKSRRRSRSMKIENGRLRAFTVSGPKSNVDEKPSSKEYMYKELSDVAMKHTNLFLKQSLKEFEISDSKIWYKAISRVLKHVEHVDTDPTRSFDVSRYVKVKKIYGATPLSSRCVDGCVFTGNVMLRQMRTEIKRPVVALVTFHLEYGSSGFVPIENAIKQERGFLNNWVKRIVSLKPKPDVLVSGANVSGYAVQLFKDAGISVICNVKPQVLEKLSRLLEADIVGTMEKLALNPRLGHCEKFEVKSFVFGNKRKTFMFFTGCKTSLGCTILLRGSYEDDTLKKIKDIVEFLIYMMHHLKLETSFFRNTYIQMAAQERQLLVTGYYSDFINQFNKKLLSISPSVKFPLPHLLQKARRVQKNLDEFQKFIETSDYSKVLDKFNISYIEISHKVNDLKIEAQLDFEKIASYLSAQRIKHINNLVRVYNREWEAFYSRMQPFLEVSFHQSIHFLYSTINVKNQSYCLFPKVIHIEYYLDYTDITLGSYLKSLLSSSDELCREGCGFRNCDHDRTYIHGDAKLTVSVEEIPCKIPGFESLLLIWNTCKICQKTTPILPMNDSTWKLSFGKFLEVLFLSIPLKISNNDCDHLLKDRILYFSLNNKAVKVEHQNINLLELIVPSRKVHWKPEVDVELKLKVYNSTITKTEIFFQGVKNRLQGVKIENTDQEKVDSGQRRIKELLVLADENYKEIIDMANNVYKSTPFVDYLSLNVVIKELQNVSASWDSEFSDFEEKYLPSEHDINRITAFQLRKFFERRTEKPEKGDEKVDKQPIEPESNSEVTSKDAPQIEKIKEMNDEDTTEPYVEHDNEKKQITVTDPSSVPGSEPQNIPELKQKPSKVLAKIMEMESNFKPDIDQQHSTETSERVTSNLLKNELQNKTNLDDYSSKKATGKVATLSKFYDQMHDDLNKEFVLQRENERRKIASRYRAIPLIPSQPIVEFYQDVEHAVLDEPERKRLKQKLLTEDTSNKKSDWRAKSNKHSEARQDALGRIDEESKKPGTVEIVDSENFDKLKKDKKNLINLKEVKENKEDEDEDEDKDDKDGKDSKVGIDDKVGEDGNDSKENKEDTESKVTPKDLERAEVRTEKSKDPTLIPEKNSLLLTLKNFWADRSVLWIPLSYPLDQTEHVFVDSDVIIREDEPSSVIAFSLRTKDYLKKISALRLMMMKNLKILPENLETENILDATGGQKVSNVDLAGKLNDLTKKTNFNFTFPGKPLGEPDKANIAANSSEKAYNSSNTSAQQNAQPGPNGGSPGTSQSEKESATLGNDDFDSDTIKPDRIIPEISSKAQEKLYEAQMLKSQATHLKIIFSEGSATFSCKVFFVEQFQAFRDACGGNFIQSLSRCVKWDSSGGKSGSFFLKTLDDRLVIKQLSESELESFIKMTPNYLSYMSRVMFHDLPSVFSKIFGFYQITIKNPSLNRNVKMNVIIMENLFYDRKNLQIFDLKGSMRNRHVEKTGKQNEVLLDENMVDYIYESPIFVNPHYKKLLTTSLWNDTLFLSKMNVMDYSLVIGIDNERNELVAGIIDCIRTFTWDKKLESWVKEKGLVGGGGKRPTVVTPKQYKSRFRAAMESYILLVPDKYFA